MAYSDSFPATRPVFMADFANGGRVDPRISYSRSTTGTFFGTAKHESSQNLITNSEDFSAWTASNTTPTANAIAAPDGTTTADTITGNSGTSSKYVLSNSISAAPYPVVSVFVKAGTHNYIQIHNDQSSTHYANFDVTSGAGVVGSVGSNTTSTIQAVGSTGWYRCICRIDTASMTSGIKVRLVDSASAAYGASSATTGTVHLWGAMANTQGDLTNVVAYQSSTGQIHREYAPTLQTAAINAPRFEHSASDSASMGLLIEGSSTNLYPYGSDQYNWSGARRLVQSNAAISPAGTLTADLVTLDATDANTHYVFQNVSVTSGTTYTISQYVKAAGLNYIALRPNTGFASNYVYFDVSNGTVISNTGGLGATIDSVGDGWYRVSVTATANATVSNATCAIYYMESSSSLVTATGDSYRGILLWGAQWEASSFASSLVNTGTSSSQLSRASDSASVVDSSLFDNGGASIVMETENTGRAYYAAVLEDDSTGLYQDYVALTVRADSKARQTVTAPGSTVASDEFSAASTVGGSYFKIASRFAPNDFGVCIDGGAVTTDTSGAVPSNVDKLFIGWYDDGGRANAHIKRVAIYPPLSDTNLQALTK